MSNNPCPVCDRPIADTAYVCHHCTGRLRRKLLDAAAIWPALESAVTRQTRLSAGGQRRGREREGGMCWCGRHRVTETPIPHETPVPWSAEAVEAGYVLEATATTWARLVEEERGTPIPQPAPRVCRATPLEPPAGPIADDHGRVSRCAWSDIPIEWCACGRHGEKTA